MNEFCIKNGLIVSGNASVSGSLTSTSLTSSLFGTASWANNAIVATSASWSSASKVAISSSWASASLSSSYALVGPFTTLLTASTYQITSSWTNNAVVATSASWASASKVAISSSWASASLTTVSSSYVSGSNGILLSFTGSTIFLNNSSSFSQEILSNVSNYAEINIQNLTSSNSASSDLVATNDTGSSNTYYVNVGINSSQYNFGFVGQNNDSYLYNTGSNLYVGNVTIGKNLYLFSGGSVNTSSVTLTSNGRLGIGTINPINILDVMGNISASIITASLFFGTASWSNNSVVATSSSFASSSITSSYSLIGPFTTLTTASTYQVTSSWSNNAIVATSASWSSQSLTASYLLSSPSQSLVTAGGNYTVNFANQYWAITNTPATCSFVSSSNISPVANTVIYIPASGSMRALSFNANWIFIGGIVPSLLTGSKSGILSFTAYANNEQSVLVAFAVQG